MSESISSALFLPKWARIPATWQKLGQDAAVAYAVSKKDNIFTELTFPFPEKGKVAVARRDYPEGIFATPEEASSYKSINFHQIVENDLPLEPSYILRQEDPRELLQISVLAGGTFCEFSVKGEFAVAANYKEGRLVNVSFSHIYGEINPEEYDSKTLVQQLVTIVEKFHIQPLYLDFSPDIITHLQDIQEVAVMENISLEQFDSEEEYVRLRDKLVDTIDMLLPHDNSNISDKERNLLHRAIFLHAVDYYSLQRKKDSDKALHASLGKIINTYFDTLSNPHVVTISPFGEMESTSQGFGHVSNTVDTSYLTVSAPILSREDPLTIFVQKSFDQQTFTQNLQSPHPEQLYSALSPGFIRRSR